MMIVPVILSGGSGSRLWPRSRQAYPKQFLPLTSTKTMFQETLSRLDGLPIQPPIIVCNKDHRFIASEQLRQTGYENATIILEPLSRNTAPAISLAAQKALELYENPILLILAADHIIADINEFHSAILHAAELAKTGLMTTFGITPTRPETGYGYIECGAPLNDNAFQIASFKEKPDLATAADYLKSDQYHWNSGMFMFKAATYEEQLTSLAPQIANACHAAYAKGKHDSHFLHIDNSLFAQSPNESIDNAVMEKTTAGAIVPMHAGWSDVGAWDSLWENVDKDTQGNAIEGNVISLDTSNCYIYSEKSLIATAGLEDLIVVESDDAILVAHKQHAQHVKTIVNTLDQRGETKHKVHRKVFRPWGHYDSIDSGSRFQVKRIKVKPGEKLSLQMHHHRAEHWIVVRGTALITCGDETKLMTENQSTYIPVGVKHRLENPGKVDLEIIEVQSGSYLGEDDIVRFDDTYGRLN